MKARLRLLALSLALIALAGFQARPALATCPTLFGTPVNAAFPLDTSPNKLVFDQELPYWMVVAVVPNNGSDWDVGVYNSESGIEPYCLSGELAGSSFVTNYADFVVGDFNHNPMGTYYWETNCFSGNCPPGTSGVGVYRNGGNIITVNSAATEVDISPSDFTDQVAGVYDVFLNSGQKYWIRFSSTGDLNAHLFVFRNPSGGTYWAGRSSAELSTAGCAIYTAPTTGWYGVVVANDGRSNNPASYTVGVFSSPNCGCPQVLASNTPVSTPLPDDSPAYFLDTDFSPFWKSIAVRGASDWDLSVGTPYSAGPNQFCTQTIGASSAFSNVHTDIVVQRDSTGSSADDTLSVTATRFSGSGSATVVDAVESGFLNYNDPVRIVNLGPNDISTVTDLFEGAGYPYNFEISTFSPDVHIHLFGPTTTWPFWATRFQGVELVNGSGFTANASGTAAVVSVKDNLNADAFSIRMGACWEAFDWPDSAFYTVSRGLSWFRLPASGPRWTAYTAFSPNADWDLGQYGHSTGSPWTVCLASPGAVSDGSGLADILVGDRRYSSSDSDFVRAKQFSTGTQVQPAMQWRPTGLQLIVGLPAVTGSMQIYVNCLDLYEVQLNAWTPYQFAFSHSGTANLHMLLFGNPGNTNYWAPRSANLFDVTSSTPFTPTRSGVYAVVVIDEDLGTDTYHLRVNTNNTGVADAVPAGPARILSLSPNPGAGPLAIEFSAGSSAPLAFDVLDAAGRRVATLSAEASGNRGSVQWSGRDDEGRVVPDGLYFLRFTEGGRTIETRKLVRLR